MGKTKNGNGPQKFWDRVSGWSKAESAANSTLVKCLHTKLGVYIKRGDTALDFGCGTGTITLRMAQYADRVHGVDISGGMLEHAQHNLEKHNYDNVEFSKITLLEEMFPDNSFQLISSFNVFQYIEGRKELFMQFNRMLKPEGILLIAVPCFRGAKGFSSFYVKLLRSLRIMPKTYFFGVEEIKNEIKKAGFTIEESVYLSGLPEIFIAAKKVSEL